MTIAGSAQAGRPPRPANQISQNPEAIKESHYHPKIVFHPISSITSIQKTSCPRSALAQVSCTNINALTIGFAGNESWNSCNLVVTKRLADAISTSLFVRLLKIELEVAGMNPDIGSAVDAGEKRNSEPAAKITIGWRQRVPDVEGNFSRREIVCIASEMRKSDGG